MQNLKKQKCFLEFLSKTEPDQRKALLRTSTTEQCLVIGEICYNILQGSAGISNRHKTRLAEHADVIRRLANRDIKDSRRRYLLVKHNEVVVEIIKAVLNSIKN